jgi:uncharacterized protein (TIGR02598 family)
MKIPKPTRQRGFSLIEVTIAMAIAAVAVVTLLGLIPQGMDTMRAAGDEAIQGRIHQQILNELQMTPFEDLGGNSPLDQYHHMEFFYDAQGEELSDSKNQGSVPEERKKGAFAHIYSARVSVLSVGGSNQAPDSVGSSNFKGYKFGGDEPNQFVRPVIVEVAPVAGLGQNFRWDEERNRNLISSYQSVVVKMGQDYSAVAP